MHLLALLLVLENLSYHILEVQDLYDNNYYNNQSLMRKPYHSACRPAVLVLPEELSVWDLVFP